MRGESRVVGGWGTTTQATVFLGTFPVPLTMWGDYSYIPLEDSLGNLVAVSFNGSTNTLQLGRPNSAGSDCNANFLMLVPVFAVTAGLQGTNLVLSFPTQSGFKYEVAYKYDLTDPQWAPLGNGIAGDNSIMCVTNEAAGEGCFYRVQIQ